MNVDVIVQKLVSYFMNCDTFCDFVIDNDVFEDKICEFVGFDNIEVSSKVMDAVKGGLISKGYTFKESSVDDFDDSDFYFEDSVKQYLCEIGRYPLLSKDEEYDLFAKVKNGDDDAFSKMMNSNLRLVVSVAKRYVGRGVDFLDLIQEGNIGLMTAIGKFNPRLGFKLSTYATLWIRQTIKRSVDNFGRTIRISVSSLERLEKLSRLRDDFFYQYRRDPSYKELADISGYSEKYIEDLFCVSMDPVCLDKPSGEFNEITPIDLLSYKDEKLVEDVVCDDDLASYLEEVINNLSEREAFVLLRRFGFVDDRVYTLEEIGNVLNLCKERIRQIEMSSLNKLRKVNKIKVLKDIYL